MIMYLLRYLTYQAVWVSSVGTFNLPVLLPPEVRSSPEVKVTSKVPLRLLARLDTLCNSIFFRAIPRFTLTALADRWISYGHLGTIIPTYPRYICYHQLYYLLCILPRPRFLAPSSHQIYSYQIRSPFTSWIVVLITITTKLPTYLQLYLLLPLLAWKHTEFFLYLYFFSSSSPSLPSSFHFLTAALNLNLRLPVWTSLHPGNHYG